MGGLKGGPEGWGCLDTTSYSALSVRSLTHSRKYWVSTHCLVALSYWIFWNRSAIQLLFSNYWMGLSIIWKIMEIEEADGEQEFHNLVRRGLRANLIPEKKNLHVSMAMGVYRWSGNLKPQLSVVGKRSGNCSRNTVSPAAKRLQVLKVGPELVNMTAVYSIGSDINGIVGRFPKVFSGVDKLSGKSIVKLHQ